MARALGRAFKITGKDVSGYGYAKPGRRPNPPPVTTIAAINGRGAYAGRSARSVMSGLSPAARLRRAKALTANERSAFAARMRAAKQRRFGRAPNVNWRGAGQRAGHVAGRAWHGTKRFGSKLGAGASAGWRAGRAAYSAHQPNRFRRPVRHFSRFGSRLGGHRANSRSRLHRRNTTMSLGKRRRMRRNRVKKGRKLSGAAKRAFLARMAAGRRKRHANKSKRRTHKRRARRSNAKRRTHKRRHTRRRARRSNAKRRTHRRRHAKRARNVRRRRNRRRVRRHSANRRRRSRRRNRRHARRARRSNAKRRTHKRRSNRRHARRRARRSNRHYADNRRRSRRRNRKHRARRRNAKRGFFAKLFKRNGAFGDLATTFTTGAFVVAGFAGHKVATKLLSDFVLDKLFGAAATPVAPPTPPATSGLDALQPYKALIAGGISALVGAVAVNMLVKDVRARMLIGGGVAASFLHTVLVTGLTKLGQPAAAGYLAGVDDGTAAQLSAMYGLGAGVSLQPQYAMLGEYFGEQPIAGLGEYFGEQVSPVSGLGEYFGEQPVAGLGAYTSNPDLAEASAGFGDITPPGGSDHISPNGDLDRELSIAEAAAGVGDAVFSQEAAAGFGSIGTLPRRDTWVPGMSDRQLWAGARGISQGQAATEMVPAGILQTSGGAGLFG